MQVDQLGLTDDTNRYAYVKNAPTYYIDPNGLAALHIAIPAVIIVGGVCIVDQKSCTKLGEALAGLFNFPDDDWKSRLGEVSENRSEICNEDEKRKKHCQALKDSILNTCAGLKGENGLRVLRLLILPIVNVWAMNK